MVLKKGSSHLTGTIIDSCRKNFKQVPSNTIDTNALYDDVRISCEKVCEKLALFSLFQDDETAGGLLGTAAEECKIDTLRVFIALGYNVKAQNIYSNTPLHNAAKSGCLEAIDILIANGANPNAQNRNGRTPLMDAVWLGKAKAVNALLAHGADPGIKTENGETALMMPGSFLAKDDAILVQNLISAGAKPDQSSNSGKTPLIAAARFGQIGNVKILLDEGVSVNAADDNGRTAIMEAARWTEDMKVISLLMSRGADINAMDKNGDTALTIAVASHLNNVGVISGILKLGADINTRNSHGMTALKIAASLGRTAMVTQITNEEDTDLDSVRIANLVAAIIEGDVSRAKTLLDGISTEMLTTELGTAERQNRLLLKAADKGMVEVVELLLDGGADINSFDGDRNTALNFAARANHISVAKLLLQRGSDVNLATDRNYTPIDWAKTDEMIQLLREYGGKSIAE